MSTLQALLDWLREERALYQDNLAQFEAGALRTENEREGRMVDTTQETGADYRRRLDRIAALIEAVEHDLAQGS
jgi:hypothetical protein